MKENNNGNDTNVGSIENSIKEDIEILVAFNLAPSLKHISEDEFKDVQKAIKHILSDYKRVLKINEVLLKENERKDELIEKMKKYLLKENKMCDFLESEE